ncbi:MAG TPA: hypothetical protein VFF49_11460 [Thermodesulfobacteriota bacterium]|nr:hypothetical protein [Thermodesulfobacteriota bacterium]
MLGEIAQSTVTRTQPPAVSELVLSTKSLTSATPAVSEYNATSKFALLVPAARYQPISVIFVAPAGLVSFVTTEEPSKVVDVPAGSEVGAVVTKPELVPNTTAISDYPLLKFN